VWKGGKEDFEILTDGIKTVKIKTVGSDSMLEILTNNGNSNKFLFMRNTPTSVDF
jgi:hypothetical protein